MNAHVHKTCLNLLSLALTSELPSDCRRGFTSCVLALRPHSLHRISFDVFHNIDLNRTSPDYRRFYLAPTTWNLFGSKGLLCWHQLRNCYIKVILTVASYLLYRYDISISPKCQATTLKTNPVFSLCCSTTAVSQSGSLKHVKCSVESDDLKNSQYL